MFVPIQPHTFTIYKYPFFFFFFFFSPITSHSLLLCFNSIDLRQFSPTDRSRLRIISRRSVSFLIIINLFHFSSTFRFSLLFYLLLTLVCFDRKWNALFFEFFFSLFGIQFVKAAFIFYVTYCCLVESLFAFATSSLLRFLFFFF